MTFRLLDKDWADELIDARKSNPDSLLIVCPFIKLNAIKKIVGDNPCKKIQVITRFNKRDFASGVSDIEALRFLLELGAEVKGIKGLHSKLYLFSGEAILTSANLTYAGLHNNYEFGCRLGQPNLVDECKTYFDSLWAASNSSLTNEDLDRWEKEVEEHQARHQGQGNFDVDDEGTDVGIIDCSLIPVRFLEAPSGYVKFFGTANDRSSRSEKIFDKVKGSGSHWACTYPTSKRPVSIEDGACIFMARMVEDPNDFMIFGRAVAMQHIHARDYATPADIEERSWKSNWPLYIRVHSGQYLGGTLANGVSLYRLFDDLGAEATAPTQRHKIAGEGKNIDPRKSVRQQAHVQLTPTALNELNRRLQESFDRFGIIPQADIDQLDKPTMPDGY
ncbi:phospholipase D family protein [Mariniblastus sp.]|nr:phospholipase D family protein [Mariniblastus sp.]